MINAAAVLGELGRGATANARAHSIKTASGPVEPSAARVLPTAALTPARRVIVIRWSG
jgi:hypothetical protein